MTTTSSAAQDPANPVVQPARHAFVTGPNGNRLSCTVFGEQHQRTVVLTSGIGCGPVFMRTIAQEFARDHRVVYWDYRSHGNSDIAPRGSGYSISEHAADLDKVVQAFVPEDQSPVMIGFSMGVQVTIEWTRLNPQRAGAYVFMLGLPRNPMHRTVVLRSKAAWLAENIGLHAGPVLQRLQVVTNRAVRSRLTFQLAKRLGWIHRECPESDFRDFLHYSTSIPLDAYLRCAAGILRHDATDTFLSIQQPVYMLAAEGDLFIDARECRAFADKLAHAQFEHLSYASHAGSIEYGTYFAGAVRRFLRRIAIERAVHAA